MMQKRQILIQLDEPALVDAIRFCGDRVDARTLAEGKTTVMATVTRTGTWKHRRYGEFSITRKTLNEMKRNFDRGTYGQDIFLDKDHDHTEGAAAKFKRLVIDTSGGPSGTKLRAELDFTPFGIQLAKERGYQYISAEYWDDYEDPETGDHHGALLAGAGFTIRPFVKGLDPVQLSEPDTESGLILLDRRVIRFLSEEIETMWKKLIEKLKADLKKLRLHESVQQSLVDSATKLSESIGDNEDAAKALVDQLVEQGKALSEQIGDREIKLSIDLPEGTPAGGQQGGDGNDPPKALTEADVNDAVAKALKDQREAEQKQLDEQKQQHDAKVKVLNDTIEKAEGIEDADKDQMKKDLGEFVSTDMDDDKIRKLAEREIDRKNREIANAKLLSQGYQVPGHAGSAHITVDDSNQIKKLEEHVDRQTGILDMSDARRYSRTGGQLLEENKKFTEKVMAKFDAENGHRLHREAKVLSGGEGDLGDVAVPAIWERQVIREALFNLVGLSLVNVDTAQFSNAVNIPYSYRDTSAAGRNSTRTYEGGAIPRAGMIQTNDTAYPIPQKLAFRVSDELRYLTSARLINWDAVAENQRNASRIVGEDTEQMIFNEILHSADEYGAQEVADEDLEPQADGSAQVFVLANWPVVRPRSIFDLQGNQIGNTVNPITVTYDGVVRAEYDGTGNQAAGTYYVLDYNLGEIHLVDETGAVITPADATAYTISYSYSTNVAKFDMDEGTDEIDLHWNGYLYQFGLRKSEIEDARYHMADIALMSGTHRTQAEQARQFAANFRRPGTDLTADGNLGRIKDVPSFKTTAPGLWMGDQRAVIGERGTTRFRMLKGWTMGELENCRDESGNFTGEKEAYGDQFVALHTPTPLKRANTTLVTYSSSARVKRAL